MLIYEKRNVLYSNLFDSTNKSVLLLPNTCVHVCAYIYIYIQELE